MDLFKQFLENRFKQTFGDFDNPLLPKVANDLRQDEELPKNELDEWIWKPIQEIAKELLEIFGDLQSEFTERLGQIKRNYPSDKNENKDLEVLDKTIPYLPKPLQLAAHSLGHFIDPERFKTRYPEISS